MSSKNADRAFNTSAIWILSVLVLCGSGLALWLIEHHIHNLGRQFSVVPPWLLCVTLLLVWLLSPIAEAMHTKVRGRFDRVVLLFLVACCAFFAWFVFHYGNEQFGAWDYSICIDTGWRQILGQRPYVDFITPNPPLFNLGVWGAFRLFGVHWNSQLDAIVLACITSFVWIYWLLRRLSASPLLSLFLAFGVETVTVLAVCFWWYNDTSELAATVFILSALVCIKQSNTGWHDWASYGVAIAIVLLAKPNVAILLVGCYVPLLIAGTADRLKAALVTIAGVALALGVLLATHVSLPAMFASYRAAAMERGGFHFPIVEGWSHERWAMLLLWFVLFAVPVWWLARSIRTSIKGKVWSETAYLLALALPVPLAFYFMVTNAEAKESETAIFLVTLGVACLVDRVVPRNVRRLFVAMAIWVTITCLFYGITRNRVYGIGPGTFYEKTNDLHPIHDRLFESMETTAHMISVEAEARRATAEFHGPIFLGPRLEFDYADLNIPSPRGWPVYYQPGTSFARRDVAALTAFWQKQHFQTLIFLHDDRTFYPESLLEAIRDDYTQQPGFSDVDVYTRKQGPK